jgi:uncharacterized membrane protein (UPF0182 family)
MVTTMQKLLAQVTGQKIDLNPGVGFDKIFNLSFPSIINLLVRFMVIIAAVIFFFMLVIGGIRWIASGGDKGQTEGARNQITAALVGLVIVFAAWAIARLIYAFFGVDILNLTL